MNLLFIYYLVQVDVEMNWGMHEYLFVISCIIIDGSFFQYIWSGNDYAWYMGRSEDWVDKWFR